VVKRGRNCVGMDESIFVKMAKIRITGSLQTRRKVVKEGPEDTSQVAGDEDADTEDADTDNADTEDSYSQVVIPE